MFDRAMSFLGLALTIILGLLSLAPEGWPKIPPWIAVSGIAIGIFLFGLGVGLITADRRRKPAEIAIENRAQVTLQLVNALNDRLSLREYNVNHWPLVYKLSDGKWLFLILFERAFDPFRAEVSIDGQKLHGSWSVGFFWREAAGIVFDSNKIKDGITVDISIYSKNFK